MAYVAFVSFCAPSATTNILDTFHCLNDATTHHLLPQRFLPQPQLIPCQEPLKQQSCGTGPAAPVGKLNMTVVVAGDSSTSTGEAAGAARAVAAKSAVASLVKCMSGVVAVAML